MQEVWRPVPGWEGFYEASSMGQLRSLPRSTRGKARIITSQPTRDGYIRVRLTAPGRAICQTFLHRVIALTFIGPCPDGLVVRHGSKGVADNSASNLSYGTQLHNMHDKKRDGTWQVADSAARRLLTSEQVTAIYLSQDSSPQLAERYGVDQTTIRAIWRRKNWASVTSALPDR